MFSYRTFFLNLTSGLSASLVAHGAYQPNVSPKVLAILSSVADVEEPNTTVSTPILVAASPKNLVAPGSLAAQGRLLAAPISLLDTPNEGSTSPDSLRVRSETTF